MIIIVTIRNTTGFKLPNAKRRRGFTSHITLRTMEYGCPVHRNFPFIFPLVAEQIKQGQIVHKTAIDRQTDKRTNSKEGRGQEKKEKKEIAFNIERRINAQYLFSQKNMQKFRKFLLEATISILKPKCNTQSFKIKSHLSFKDKKDME